MALEKSKAKMVKFKVDEESDSDGLFSDDHMSYDSSDSDTSDLKVTGGYCTKEMFLKKYVIIILQCAPFVIYCIIGKFQIAEKCWLSEDSKQYCQKWSRDLASSHNLIVSKIYFQKSLMIFEFCLK